ncbi:ROK family transcriptional regulator [Streptomyces beijiangensis]|uniref:ROK family transcriptional regulator n=1 Tax=Streptomyces beijiangensis TaxID=163361 RepID=A0A939F4U2_9ACTN|nr:ROK family transcriptional regulator [Streptomyces beijiangensis]MBO0510405.1 ROK family transcriptional regulator [Streptomyces beijiangensis]
MLRRLNAAAVLRVLYEAQSLTLTELVQSTAVTRATVENALAGLTEQSWVEEVAPDADGPRQVGRPAKRYRFRAEAGCVLGLDIGVHTVRAVVTDLKGEVLGVRHTAVTPGLPGAERIAAARVLGRRALRGCDRTTAEVRAVGIGTTGIVDASGKVTLSALLPDWAGTDLCAALAEPFDAPVVVGNDSKLAALGEHWKGAAAAARDVLYIHAGRGISAGMLIDAKVHAGRRGAAGEIGNLPASRWHTAPARLLGWTGEGQGDAEALFAAVRERDPRALRILEQYADDLVQGVAAMVLALDPELVVVGGGVARAGDLLLDPLRSRLDGLVLFPVEVVASTLGDRSVALGAVRLALDEVEKQLFEVASRG